MSILVQEDVTVSGESIISTSTAAASHDIADGDVVGNIDIQADGLIVSGASRIESSSVGNEGSLVDAGTIDILVKNSVSISGESTISTSTATDGSDNGISGGINIGATDIDVFGSEITSETTGQATGGIINICLLYTSPSPRDRG